jgi:CheY-like chemotaxis protein
MSANLSFSFLPSEFSEKFKQSFDNSLTGYWRVRAQKVRQQSAPQLWYIAVSQGKIVFSGKEKLSASTLLVVLQRYLPRLRAPKAQEILNELNINETALPLGKLLARIQQLDLLTHDEAIQALRLKVLADCDQFIHETTGQADFIPDYELVANAPIRGFDLYSVLLDSANRRSEWQQIQEYFPSIDAILTLSAEALAVSDLPTLQRQHLQRLLLKPVSLGTVADYMGADALNTAKGFIQLQKRGIIQVEVPAKQVAQTQQIPKIFIVDDSPVLLKQFSVLVESWGYQVETCSQALSAVETMMQHQPAVVFLDINMPGTSGFELIKQIRRQPQLSEVPLVLLTAEKTVSNQWRAQWASCKFLAKPRSTEEIASFKLELQTLLHELAPMKRKATPAQVMQAKLANPEAVKGAAG